MSGEGDKYSGGGYSPCRHRTSLSPPPRYWYQVAATKTCTVGKQVVGILLECCLSYRLTVCNTSCRKVMLSQACVKDSVQGGHVWQEQHAWQVACVVVGRARQRGMCGRGACMVGGMHGRGCAWWGACMAGGVCGRGAFVVGAACMAGGRAWQERRPLQRTVRILLECILVI